MILLADSGSTKCDWVLMQSGKKERTYTPGLNPFFQTTEELAETVSENKLLNEAASTVRELYFYGAGCRGEEAIKRVEMALQSCFPKAKIAVESDLMASVLSCYRGKAIIVGILGTGSNCCYYDGQAMHKARPSLGFILGDEGSGAYFGKALLRAYLYRELPADLERAFAEAYGVDLDTALESVYRKPHPNRYLAGFVPFIATHIDQEYLQNLIYTGFMEFLKIHVCSMDQAKSLDLHFVGSIAVVFEAQLKRAAKDLNLSISSLNQKPMEGLIFYHENK